MSGVFIDTTRLSEIARAATLGMPPPSFDDIRYLLDVIQSMATTGPSSIVAAAASYKQPRMRCLSCDGDGQGVAPGTSCGACGGSGFEEA